MKAPTFNDIHVVGMHFREREGVPAKSIVANLIPPATFQMEREPDNKHDAFAIKVLYDGQHIGYVEASVACFLAPWMDDGNEYTLTMGELVEVKRNLQPLCTAAPVEAEED